MAKLTDDGRILDDKGEWEYQAGGMRPWRRIADGAASGDGKPGVRETFAASEMARQERIKRRTG